jgi:hypothetical protein
LAHISMDTNTIMASCISDPALLSLLLGFVT